MILNSISKFLSRIYTVDDKILIYLAPSGFRLENENQNRFFSYFIEVIFIPVMEVE